VIDEIRQILYMLPVSVARFSACGVTIYRYVLPVLGMTSCFHIVGPLVRHVYAYNSTAVQRRPKITTEH